MQVSRDLVTSDLPTSWYLWVPCSQTLLLKPDGRSKEISAYPLQTVTCISVRLEGGGGNKFRISPDPLPSVDTPRTCQKSVLGKELVLRCSHVGTEGLGKVRGGPLLQVGMVPWLMGPPGLSAVQKGRAVWKEGGGSPLCVWEHWVEPGDL